MDLVPRPKTQLGLDIFKAMGLISDPRAERRAQEFGERGVPGERRVPPKVKAQRRAAGKRARTARRAGR